MSRTYYAHGTTIAANGVTVMKIPAIELMVDASYQRPVSPGRVNRISQGFDWDACGIIKVAPKRDGKHPVIDGQHRLRALVKKYPTLKWGNGKPIEVLAVVHNKVKTVQDEAHVFRVSNTNVAAVNRNGNFKASACEGLTNALAVERLLLEAGLRIEYGPGRNANGVVKCPADFQAAYESLGEQRFGLLLEIVCSFRSDDGKVDARALKADCVIGLTKFIGRHKTTPVSKLRRIKDASIYDIYETARQLMLETTVVRAMGSRHEAYAKAFEETLKNLAPAAV